MQRQMTYSSCLNDTLDDLLLDTSVFINLSGSGVISDILNALPHRILMTQEAAGELVPTARSGRNDLLVLQSEVAAGRIELLNLAASARLRFARLISDSERPLGDGEAATIAAAETQDGIAVIDDRRARIIGSTGYLASSIDLFAHRNVIGNLGHRKLADAVYFALKNSRMAVQENQREWAISLLGIERALECNSLPRHRELVAEHLQDRRGRQTASEA